MRKYNFHDHKSVVTPFDSSVHLFPVNNDDEIFNQKDYASIIGNLRYAIDCTIPTLHMQYECLADLLANLVKIIG